MGQEKAKAGEGEPRQADAPETEAGQGGGEPAIGEELAAKLDEAARAEAEDYRDKLLRAHAELENVRKRAERDVEAARKYALEKFATELLGVRDSLELGLRAAEEESGGPDKLKEGMDLTARMLAQAMEKFGIETLDPEGEAFDPSYHQAMSTRESAEHEPNTVLAVMQKGYLLNGRVLRPAMVVVSRRPEADNDA
jgi:molecular chaperone GrpE